MRATSWLLAAAWLSATALPLASAAAAAVDRPFPLVTVTGEGTVAVAPDIAHATAGVASDAKTPREAAEANAAAMRGVISSLKDAGLAEADIRTARFSIAPVYTQRQRDGQPQVSGYRVSNQVRVTVRDVAKLGEVLDKLVAAGATNISSVDFAASNPSKLLDEARLAAFADARRKAELFAKAAGAQVGRAVNIAEDEGQSLRPLAMRAASPVAGTPIEPGEETLRVQVTVSFELSQ